MKMTEAERKRFIGQTRKRHGGGFAKGERLSELSKAADASGVNRTTAHKRYKRHVKRGLSHEEAFRRATTEPPMNHQEIGRCGAKKRWKKDMTNGKF